MNKEFVGFDAASSDEQAAGQENRGISYLDVPELCTEVREALLGLKLYQVARLLDAFYLHGAMPGQVMSVALTQAFCRHYHIQMKLDTIRAIFKTILAGQRIFAEVQKTYPPGGVFFTPKSPLKESQNQENSPDSKARDSVRNGSEKSRGRPTIWYVIPDPMQLGKVLEVKQCSFAPLAAEDVTSPKLYRQALHKSYIAQYPDDYSRAELSGRLAVSASTTRQYDKGGGIKVTRQLDRKPIRKADLDSVKFYEKPAGGVFLQDVGGNPYPALRAIAERLIERDGWVWYVRQRKSHYCVPGYEAGIEG